MDVVVLESADEIARYSEDLEDLANCSVSENVFFEWWMLCPALQFLRKPEERIIVALVWDKDIAKLVGLFPLARNSKYSCLPLPHFALWRHFQLLLGDPLVRRGAEKRCFDLFFRWAESVAPPAYLINFGSIAGQGGFAEALFEYCRMHGRAANVVSRQQRAFLTTEEGYGDYLKKLPKKRRKELGRLERRLGELGVVEKSILKPGDSTAELDCWLEQFLQLEGGGWKGREGTSLDSKSGETKYFYAITREAHRRGMLSMVRLSLGSEAVAMQCNIHDRRGSYSYKIAYDERFGQCSPGILVANENLRFVLEESGLESMDSGADPDHPMINRLWHERREILSINIGFFKLSGRIAYATVVVLRKMFKMTRELRKMRAAKSKNGRDSAENGGSDEQDIEH